MSGDTAGDTMSGVARPRTGETPQHNVRVPAELWNAAVAKARGKGTTLSKVMVEFLREFVDEDGDDE